MEMTGKLVVCDICANSVFLKFTGEKDLDGGFTRFNTFESSPDGWDRYKDIGQVCPTCHEKIINYANELKRHNDHYATMVMLPKEE